MARNYVKAVAMRCSYIDYFLSWDILSVLPEHDAVDLLKSKQYTVMIYVCGRRGISRLVTRAKIPVRVATTRYFRHVFDFNRLIMQNHKF